MLPRRISITTLVVLSLMWSVSPGGASTNGYLLNCFCARSFGRGATVVAIPDNASVLLANPAELGFLTGRAAGIGLGLLIPEVKFQNSANPLATADQKLYPMPFTAYVDPMAGSKWAWGLGVNVVGGMGADYQLNNDLFRDPSGAPTPLNYYSKLGYMKIGPGVAYKLRDDLAVGAGVQVYYGQLDFKMPFSLNPVQNMNGIADPGNGMTFGQLFAGMGYDEVTAYAAMNNLDGFGIGANLGIYWRVNGRLSLGFAYNSASRIHFNGEAEMDMTAQMNDAFGRAVQGVLAQNPGMSQQDAQMAAMQMFGQMGVDLAKGAKTNYSQTKAQFNIPQKFAAGLGLKPLPKLTFGLDVEWIDWSAAFDDFPLDFANGTNDNINLMLNGDAKSGGFSYAFPLQWQDSWNFKLGLDYQVTPSTNLRAGFIHGQNPVPDNTVFAIFPAIVENHVTFGVGHMFGKYGFDLAYVRALNHTQNAVTSGHLVGAEYNGSVDQLAETLIVTTVMIAL